jgi:tetratricopeptide (TPR) repeat protein
LKISPILSWPAEITSSNKAAASFIYRLISFHKISSTFHSTAKMNYRSSLLALILCCGTVFTSLGQTTAEELFKLYGAGQLNAVIARGEQELKSGGEQALVNQAVGRAYADKDEFQAAIPYLTKSVTAASATPDVKAWGQAYLGTCYYGLQDYTRAKTALEAAVAANATRNATAYANKRLGMLRGREAATQWQTVETTHFRFHFQAPKNLGTSPEAFAALHEQAYETNNRFFQATLPRKVDFYVWDDRAEALRVLGQPLGFTQANFLTIHAMRDQTRGHEIAHQLMHFGLRPSQQRPLISEGIAVCFDQSGTNRLQTARQAAAGPVDVWKMWEQPNAYSERQLYAVGGALLEYLLAHAPEAQVKQLLREQTPQLGRQLFSQQVADFEKELASGAVSTAPPAFPTPTKVDATKVNAVVERTNKADKYYNVLILLNGVPISAPQMKQLDPQKLRNMKVLHNKEEMQAYTEVEVNGIILLLTES